jgi:ankyrin repeat protein
MYFEGEMAGLGPYLVVTPQIRYTRTWAINLDRSISIKSTVEIERRWDMFDQPPGPQDIGVAMLLVDGRATQIQVFAAATPSGSVDSAQPVRFEVPHREPIGAPVLLLFNRTTGWVKPRPLFRDPAGARFIARMHWAEPAELARLAADLPDPEATVDRGGTLLHICARSDLPRACEALLAAGAKSRLKDDRGLLAHEVAAEMSASATVAVFARSTKLSARAQHEMAARALQRCDLDCVRAICEPNGTAALSADQIDQTIHYALASNRADIVYWVRQNMPAFRYEMATHLGERLNSGGISPLPRNQVTVFPTMQSDSLSQAGLADWIAICDRDTVLELLALQARPPSPLVLHRLLRTAADAGNLGAVEALLDQKAPVDHPEVGGDGPLILAASAGHGPVVRRLISAGARVDARGIGGRTALLVAVDRHDVSLVRDLLAAGASIANTSGQTCAALAHALQGHDRTIVEALAESGARIDIHDANARMLVEASLALDARVLIERAESDGWILKTPLASGRDTLETARAYDAEQTTAWLERLPAYLGQASTPAVATAPGPAVEPHDLRIEDTRPVGGMLPTALFEVSGILTEEGRLTYARIRRSDDPRCNAEVLRSVAGYRFAPVTLDGRPTACRVTYLVRLPARDDRLFATSELDAPPRSIHTPRLPQRSTSDVTTDTSGEIVAQKSPRADSRTEGSAASHYWANVRFVIERDGRTSHVEVVHASHPILQTTAASTVGQYRYQPCMRNGVPVRVLMELRVE